MELNPYLDGLGRDLAAAAAPGGPEVARAAELLVGSLDAAARLVLLEILSDAAAEITTKLDDVTVDVQLRGREAQFVVTSAATPPVPTPDLDTGDLVRITLRLPEGLKDSVERLAATAGVSVNAWLVRAIGAAVVGTTAGGEPGSPAGAFPGSPPGSLPRRGKLGKRVTGFAQA